jgi:hypothetical protein
METNIYIRLANNYKPGNIKNAIAWFKKTINAKNRLVKKKLTCS